MQSWFPPLSALLQLARVRPARPLGAILALLAVAAVAAPLGVLASAGPAHGAPPSAVSVEDTVGVVDASALSAELEEIDFRRPVELQVLVLDVRDHGLDPADDLSLNDAVLAHARSDAPQLLSADGEHWADGLVLLAIDPRGRLLGSYAGEDVKLTEGGFESVQDDMRDPAADGQWEEAFTEGADTYAALLDRPWWQNPASIGVAVVAIASALIAVASILVGSRRARQRVDAALPRYEDVQSKRRLTDAAARNLPRDSPYTPAALSDHERYREQIVEAEELLEQLPPPHRRGWGWGLRGTQRRLSREVSATVAELDDLDDDIIATHDLLHRLGDWRAAWERELDPLRDSVSSLDEVLEDHTGSASDLRDLGSRITTETDRLTTDLEADAITPDAALERLDELTGELSGVISALHEREMGLLAEDEEEAEVLREVEVDPEDHEELRYRSVRERRRALDLAQDGQATVNGAAWHLNPVLWYSIWHTESSSALESHRNPASGAGSSSGYSAGGFAGAGSSSSF